MGKVVKLAQWKKQQAKAVKPEHSSYFKMCEEYYKEKEQSLKDERARNNAKTLRSYRIK